MDLAIEFVAASIRIATPLLLAALGGIISERAGVFAVGLEGMMLVGAAGGLFAAFGTDSALLGLAGAALAGAALGVVIATATIVFRADHIVVALASNILALGLTSFMLRAIAGSGAIRVEIVEPIAIPILDETPIIGALLFNQPPLTYFAFLLTIPIYLLLTRTQAGLTLRSVGENPEAAYAMGANPIRVRFASVIACGMIASLGGAVLTLQQVGSFTDNMTAGRGYIALAAVIAARWSPVGVIATCLLFGAAEALQLRVQGYGLPVSSYIVQMTPYLVSLLVLSGFGRSSRMPASIGRHFSRE